jgi:hypothetical protein
MLNTIIEHQINSGLHFLKAYDDTMNTNYTRTYKRFIWWNMNEVQKPIMISLFSNGRIWRRWMDKFLTI